MRELHTAGLSRNDIAREIGRSPSTVSKIARELGIHFDRAATAAATMAKQRDNRARRADLVARLYTRAETILDRLEAPVYDYTATTVRGIETATLDHVPAPDEKALAGAISAHLAAAARLEAIDADQGAGEARSMLAELADRLRTAWQASTEEVPDSGSSPA